ncbi:hypothetical protein L6270_01100 [Candidatus Parcubacteria bacterium]|nr:hypothetical protein [Patescibacteria group bacterium]MBU4309743.1 hypothetical protein [Patescibacteria group bacterium]MBU4431650.1 hypothetical protein [Patescibacteria group bacterium]MBU4578082.1 hypothetical protein [Patescibacteria group bacterium]MCG2696620.1 hypothetical protein [Candidatus Parcubacteria bacterium]
MPVIRVWCLPPSQSEKALNRLHRAIVKAVVSISELGLKDENDMTCLFVPDLMAYGLGEEIIVEIVGLLEKPGRNEMVRQRLARRVGKCIKKLYPGANVASSISTIGPNQGYWESEKK